MKIRKIWTLILGVASLTFAPSIAMADAGRIEIVAGTAKVVRGFNEYRAVKDALLLTGDKITTGFDSTVQWRLEDDSFYTMGANSELTITEFSLNKNAAPGTSSLGQLTLDLIKGGFRSISGFIGTRSRQAYSIRTPAATMGIRGTDYTLLHFPPDEASSLGIDSGTYVLVHTGAVIITSRSGDSMVVTAGKIAFVGPGAAPIELLSLPNAIAEWINSAEFEFDVEFFEQIDIDVRIESEPPVSPS